MERGAVFYACVFRDNQAGEYGGGSSGEGEYYDCRFINNHADEFGGGGSHGGSRFERVLFEGNTAEAWGGMGGGGAFGAGTFVDVVFRNNSAGWTGLEHQWGGGGYCGSGTFVNVLFEGNDSYIGGGLSDRGTTSMTNCTFVANTGSIGSAYYGWLGSSTLANSIVWSAGHSPSSPVVALDSSTLDVSNSDVEGSGGSGGAWDPDFGSDLGGNIDADPHFRGEPDPGTPYQPGLPYRVWPYSPVVDAGDDAEVPVGIIEDLIGDPRIAGLAVDMGAYEHQGVRTGVNGSPTAIGRESAVHQNQPNPFNPRTSIRYVLAASGDAELVVYDLAGRRVKELVFGHVEAGPHETQWDGTDRDGRRVASGVYLYRLVAGEFIETKRMVLLK